MRNKLQIFKKQKISKYILFYSYALVFILGCTSKNGGIRMQKSDIRSISSLDTKRRLFQKRTDRKRDISDEGKFLFDNPIRYVEYDLFSDSEDEEEAFYVDYDDYNLEKNKNTLKTQKDRDRTLRNRRNNIQNNHQNNPNNLCTIYDFLKIDDNQNNQYNICPIYDFLKIDNNQCNPCIIYQNNPCIIYQNLCPIIDDNQEDNPLNCQTKDFESSQNKKTLKEISKNNQNPDNTKDDDLLDCQFKDFEISQNIKTLEISKNDKNLHIINNQEFQYYTNRNILTIKGEVDINNDISGEYQYNYGYNGISEEYQYYYGDNDSDSDKNLNTISNLDIYSLEFFQYLVKQKIPLKLCYKANKSFRNFWNENYAKKDPLNNIKRNELSSYLKTNLNEVDANIISKAIKSIKENNDNKNESYPINNSNSNEALYSGDDDDDEFFKNYNSNIDKKLNNKSNDIDDKNDIEQINTLDINTLDNTDDIQNISTLGNLDHINNVYNADDNKNDNNILGEKDDDIGEKDDDINENSKGKTLNLNPNHHPDKYSIIPKIEETEEHTIEIEGEKDVIIDDIKKVKIKKRKNKKIIIKKVLEYPISEKVKGILPDNYKTFGPEFSFGKDWPTDIKSSFRHLKKEVLNNKYAPINAKTWNGILKKCEKILKGEFSSKRKNRWAKLLRDNKIRMKHLVTLKLYTDFDLLQREFRKSFRSPWNKEKDRLGSFFHWKRLLKETFDKFSKLGLPLHQPSKVYMGINSQMCLEEFSGVLHGPSSTTTDLHVARSFAGKNGMILVIRDGNFEEILHIIANSFLGINKDILSILFQYYTFDYPNSNIMLDISWISDYPDEREYLLLDHKIKIETWILSQSYDQYYHFYHSTLTKNKIVKAPTGQLTYRNQINITNKLSLIKKKLFGDIDADPGQGSDPNEDYKKEVCDFNKTKDINKRQKLYILVWLFQYIFGHELGVAKKDPEYQLININIQNAFKKMHKIIIPKKLFNEFSEQINEKYGRKFPIYFISGLMNNYFSNSELSLDFRDVKKDSRKMKFYYQMYWINHYLKTFWKNSEKLNKQIKEFKKADFTATEFEAFKKEKHLAQWFNNISLYIFFENINWADNNNFKNYFKDEFSRILQN